MQDLIQPSEAEKRISEALPEFDSELRPLEACPGLVLREPIIADRPFPPFDRSMMDGYALLASDLPTIQSFTVVAEAPAGKAQIELARQQGHAVEIMTGAILPRGTDLVIPYEATVPTERGFRVRSGWAFTEGDNIHRRGSDHAEKTALASEGRLLNTHLAGLAATCGYSHLRVTRPPSIAVLGTGDEAVPIEATPAAHQIRRSNAVALQTGLHNAGLRNCRSFHLPDAMDALIEGLEARIASDDILIITGGISMGKRDLIPEALDRLNFRCHFHGVQQKPGKPFAFYSRGDKAVFGLPGNPLSAICCLHHYVIPAVYAAMGASRPPEPRHGRLTAAAPGRTGMTRFLPVALEADDRCHPHPPSNSGDLVTVLKTDGYLLVPEGEEAVAGARFAYFPWH